LREKWVVCLCQDKLSSANHQLFLGWLSAAASCALESVKQLPAALRPATILLRQKTPQTLRGAWITLRGKLMALLVGFDSLVRCQQRFLFSK
jgi:hypothetical protein